jgi:hypothetical protein
MALGSERLGRLGEKGQGRSLGRAKRGRVVVVLARHHSVIGRLRGSSRTIGCPGNRVFLGGIGWQGRRIRCGARRQRWQHRPRLLRGHRQLCGPVATRQPGRQSRCASTSQQPHRTSGRGHGCLHFQLGFIQRGHTCARCPEAGRAGRQQLPAHPGSSPCQCGCRRPRSRAPARNVCHGNRSATPPHRPTC